MKKGNSSDGDLCTSDFGNFQVESTSYKWVRTEMYTVTSQRSNHSSLLIAYFRQRRGFLPSKQLLPSSGSIFSSPRSLSRAITCTCTWGTHSWSLFKGSSRLRVRERDWKSVWLESVTLLQESSLWPEAVTNDIFEETEALVLDLFLALSVLI